MLPTAVYIYFKLVGPGLYDGLFEWISSKMKFLKSTYFCAVGTDPKFTYEGYDTWFYQMRTRVVQEVSY